MTSTRSLCTHAHTPSRSPTHEPHPAMTAFADRLTLRSTDAVCTRDASFSATTPPG